MQDAQAVAAVGDIGEDAGIYCANFHVVYIVQLAVRVKHLIEARVLGLLDVDEGDSVLASGDIRMRSRDCDIARVLQFHKCAGHDVRVRKVGYVEHLHSLVIGDEGVAELHGDALRIREIRRGDFCRHARGERVIEVDDDEASVA